MWFDGWRWGRRKVWTKFQELASTPPVVSKSVHCSLYFDQIFCFPDHHHRYHNFDPHHQKCLKVYTLSAGRHYHSAFADMESSFICIAAASSYLVQETQHKIAHHFLESINTTKWKNRFENVGIGPFPPFLHGCLWKWGIPRLWS